jgi:uncharacterized membrane protein
LAVVYNAVSSPIVPIDQLVQVRTMSLPLAATLAVPQIEFPGGTQLILMLLRWIHFIAGILWIGLLYYFNLVSTPFLQELDPQTRMAVVPRLMPRALWWFRWSSVVTVLAGIVYWMHIVATDVSNAQANGIPASAVTMTASFFLLWTLAFAIQMGVLMSPAEALHRGPIVGLIVGVVVVVTAYIFLALNQHGWESSRALAIGIGGGLGWFMMMNVWGIVWRMHKKILRWTEAATRGESIPAEFPRVAGLASLTARISFWLSFPMLFFMGAASHYIVLGAR